MSRERSALRYIILEVESRRFSGYLEFLWGGWGCYAAVMRPNNNHNKLYLSQCMTTKAEIDILSKIAATRKP